MGRRRKFDKHLPRRMYLRRGSYYFASPNGRWYPLGKDYALAMAEYGRLTGPHQPCRTLGDVIARYRIDVLPGKGDKTQINERPQLDKLVKVFGNMLPDEVTQQHVYQYMDTRAAKVPSAAKHEVTLLSHVFTKAIRWGAATKNPVQGVEKPRSNPLRRYVTDEEFQAVRNLASPQLQVAMDLALLTGLRRGDLLSLTRDHLIDDGLLVNTSKTGQALLFEYSTELHATLARAKNLKPQVPGTYLIRTKSGKQYTGSGFSSNWKRLIKKAEQQGIKAFTFHDLRRKNASDSDSLQEASDRLGHSSTTLTKKAYMAAPMKVKPLK